jgi:hypothetical protein
MGRHAVENRVPSFKGPFPVGKGGVIIRRPDETGDGGGFVRANNATLVAPAIGAATATTASAGDNDTSVATTAFVHTEVDSTKSGTHATPSTTTPLSPTWSGPAHVVWSNATSGTINLPAASGYVNRGILIYNIAATVVRIDPNASEGIVRDGTAQTGGKYLELTSGTGNYVSLICDGERWITLGFKGSLSAEP